MLILTVLLALLQIWTASAATLAFPEAEGLGRFATGGRAGSNYVVSNLQDSGPGSLRDALAQSGRIVTFNVSGIIKIKKRLVMPKKTSVLGQTAPGEGITVYGNGWSFSGADDSIIRYMRIRMGAQGEAKKDCVGIANGHNIIFDHVSVSWGRDETFSINAYEKGGNITIQDSIIAQGLETHSAGGLMQVKAGISIFRSLWADNKTRNPKVKGRNDFTNNVIYNWGGGGGYIAGGSEGASSANIVGNYFIAGPSTGKTKAFTRGNDQFKATVKNNYVDDNRNGVLDGKELPANNSAYGGLSIVTTNFGFPPPRNVMSAPDALKYVLKNAGASKSRDAVDKQLVDQVQSWGKSGKLIHDESQTVWGEKLGAGKKKPQPAGEGGGDKDKNKNKDKKPKARSIVYYPELVDSDGDGIPDIVEDKMGWDKFKNDAMVIQPSGYTRLEEWANSLVVDL